MAGETVLKILTALLGFSVALECGVLSGLWTLSSGPYHAMHLLLMASVLAATLALYRHRRSRGAADSAVPLWFAAGLGFTGIGDYVNSALSTVDPVAPKLTWAMLFFGLGYSCYVIGLWKGLALLGAPKALSPGAPKALWAGVPRVLWAIIPVMVVGNVMTWLTRVQHLVAGYPVLSWGSFVFNATIYVALPWLAIRYLIAQRFSLPAVVVTVGIVFLVYSDLVLFDAWLKLEAGRTIPVAMYAANWILYFGGQCLTNVFPSAVAAKLDADTAQGRDTYSVTTP